MVTREPIPIEPAKTLADLLPVERAHWELHIKACAKDTPSVGLLTDALLAGGDLPNIKHPAYIHDWLEQPDRRKEIEAWNG